MPSITKLKIQKNKKRVNLFFDNQFAFGLSLNQVVKNGLAVGQKLTNKQTEKLFFSSQLEKLYNKVLNYLSYRPRSKKEIRDYISKNCLKTPAIASDLRQKIQAKVFKKLEKQKLIDDEKFALWWLEQRLTYRPKGKRLLKAELYNKGVDKEIIDSLTALITPSKEKKAAQQIINKKLKLYKNLAKLKLKQKLFSHLARRGFDFQIAQNAIDEAVEK